ncbi:hypothetical protein [Gordonia mangrovi]|nr:hypothetical protein [Gordonia mangrovi]UVF76268.1 hypothetical protein NWF22_12725 [Gordonia mangrovi]
MALTSFAGLNGTTATFSELAGQFTGATSDMSAVAASADDTIATSLENVSGTVSAFSELVLAAKNTAGDTDEAGAARIRDAVPYPTRQGQQVDRTVPFSVLMSVQHD